MKSVKPEAGIQRAILDYLEIRQYFCWRNNTGAAVSSYNGKSRFFRYGLIGSGDILGLTKAGRFFSVEVKAPGKKPSENQENFIAKVNASGGLAFVAYDVDDVIAAGL